MADGNPDVTLDTVHGDLTAGFADMRTGFADVKAELRAGFADLKATLVNRLPDARVERGDGSIAP